MLAIKVSKVGEKIEKFLVVFSILLLPFLSLQSCLGTPLFSNIIMYMERVFGCLGDGSTESLPELLQEISYLLSVLEKEVQT